MLTFMRNKLVGIERRDQDTLVAFGFLDDDIYGMELVTAIRISDRTIVSIEGRFHRYTTPECPKAVPVLQRAVGLCIEEEGFGKEINREIGRKGCRHFANLLLECCATAREQLMLTGQTRVMGPEDVASTGPGIGTAPNSSTIVISNLEAQQETKRNERDQIFIDLHVHTSPASPCCMSDVDSQILEAKRIGLDGICLTDHNFVWDLDTVEELRQRHGFLVLRGNEVTTDQGDVLVFGLDRRIEGIIQIEALRRMVLDAEGYMIVAHPFRGFLTFGVGQLGLTVEVASQRSLFKYIDGVEVLNGRVTEKENQFAFQVAAHLGITATGGSDSHETKEIGVYATRFPGPLTSERDLISALKKGGCLPIAFRKERGILV